MAGTRVELKRLIKQYRQLLEYCQSVLKKFPGPIPDPLPRLRPPLVALPNQPPQPLSEAESKQYIERENIRLNLLAVHLPFHAAYTPAPGDTPSPGQQAGVEIRRRLDSVTLHLRDHYHHNAENLRAFPWANWGTGFGPSMTVQQVMKAIERHIQLLRSSLKELGDEGKSNPGSALEKLRRGPPPSDS